jgi:hypothetical protein
MAQVKSAETGTAPAAILGTHPDFDDAGSNFMRRTHVESLLCSGHHGHREKRRTQGGFPKPKKKNVMNRMNMCLGLSSTHFQTTI